MNRPYYPYPSSTTSPVGRSALERSRPFAPRADLLNRTTSPHSDENAARGRRRSTARRQRRVVEIDYEPWSPGRSGVVASAQGAERAGPALIGDVAAGEPFRAEAADHIAAVAGRVRRGELPLVGVRSGMTEAGALAAALAAILSGTR